jgi:hypothetical protein
VPRDFVVFVKEENQINFRYVARALADGARCARTDASAEAARTASARVLDMAASSKM